MSIHPSRLQGMGQRRCGQLESLLKAEECTLQLLRSTRGTSHQVLAKQNTHSSFEHDRPIQGDTVKRELLRVEEWIATTFHQGWELDRGSNLSQVIMTHPIMDILPLDWSIGDVIQHEDSIKMISVVSVAFSCDPPYRTVQLHLGPVQWKCSLIRQGDRNADCKFGGMFMQR